MIFICESFFSSLKAVKPVRYLVIAAAVIFLCYISWNGWRCHTIIVMMVVMMMFTAAIFRYTRLNHIITSAIYSITSAICIFTAAIIPVGTITAAS